ncbi:hypothetical protein [Methanoculleus chikugoensis]|uniref:hypothetical protein n=1 Tax=Methanoculleus chikugoensis TaxID=118126 RepID=UPI0006D1CFC0|nr:hypothetical protein [Methanoculleus chikugoensis]
MLLDMHAVIPYEPCNSTAKPCEVNYTDDPEMPEYTSRTYDEDRSLLTLQSIVAEDFRTAGG